MRHQCQCRLLKYECITCNREFIVEQELTDQNKSMVCPYCASGITEWVAGPPNDEAALYDELGCMGIGFEKEKHQKKG